MVSTFYQRQRELCYIFRRSLETMEAPMRVTISPWKSIVHLNMTERGILIYGWHFRMTNGSRFFDSKSADSVLRRKIHRFRVSGRREKDPSKTKRKDDH